MRTCSHCRSTELDVLFFKNAAKASGLSTLCKSCYAAYEGQPHRRARRTWHTLNARVKRQAAYDHVSVNMTQQEYLEWALPAYSKWMADNPGKTPSIDRIDPAGNYALDNIRLIERGENSRLASNHPNVHAPLGKAWCPQCAEYLPVSSFWRCAGKFNGLQTRCKPCQTAAIKRSAANSSCTSSS